MPNHVIKGSVSINIGGRLSGMIANLGRRRQHNIIDCNQLCKIAYCFYLKIQNSAQLCAKQPSFMQIIRFKYIY